ncbi:MAG: preprotein translocase subunit SecG [Clostridiales bacterium]|nr:preprotein translocase subunit SecG [Clostridia bacterium]MCR4563173.1 preprotein translocase subunit SecG [Clostridiales bacterium]
MSAFEIVLGVLLIIVCIALTVIVMIQEESQSGLSGAIAGGSSDTFFGKNKGRTSEAKLKKLTKIIAIVFLVLSLATVLLLLFIKK